MVSISHFFRSNARRSALRILSAVLLVTATVAFLAGCSNGSDPTLPVGSWESSHGEVYTITGSSVTYASDGTSTTYEASIVYVDDSSLNGGDTSVTAGGDVAVNPGFAVIQYASATDASWGEEGKYNVFRWADGTTDAARIMTQGGKYNEDYSVLQVFDSVSGAITGATNAAGYFGFASTVTEQE